MMMKSFSAIVQKEFSGIATIHSASNYLKTLQSVSDYYGDDLELDALFSHDYLSMYRDFLLSHGVNRNAITFYMRSLFHLYNCAVRQRLMPPVEGLFSEVLSKNEIPNSVLTRLADADLSAYPHFEFDRDMFLLTVYLGNISYLDLAYLRKSDFKDTRILQYFSYKMNRKIEIRLSADALSIIQKYSALHTDSCYLLPIFDKHYNSSDSLEEKYRKAFRSYNRHLTQIGRVLDIRDILSFSSFSVSTMS